MKNKMVVLTVATALVITSLSAMAQQDDNVKRAKKRVAQSKKELKEARQDSTDDYRQFRKESELKIVENEAKIAELRKKAVFDNKESQDNYISKVNAIERKNNDLKNRMINYRRSDNTMWADFKRNFKNDMEVLNKTFIEL